MRAPRQPDRWWRRWARGALICLGTVLTASGSVASEPQIVAAAYSGATGRYDHLVLGRDHNWANLDVLLSDGRRQRILHKDLVFEDTAPRVLDLDGDSKPEIIVVESIPHQGARLAIYGLVEGALTLLASTPYIGRSHRWLAFAGAADLDGDGETEVVYVDRPHLAKVLRVWSYTSDPRPKLRERGSFAGVTNHRIGSPVIEGGIRQCDGSVEIVLASGDWTRKVAVRFDGHDFALRDLGLYTNVDDLALEMACN